MNGAIWKQGKHRRLGLGASPPSGLLVSLLKSFLFFLVVPWQDWFPETEVLWCSQLLGSTAHSCFACSLTGSLQSGHRMFLKHSWMLGSTNGPRVGKLSVDAVRDPSPITDAAFLLHLRIWLSTSFIPFPDISPQKIIVMVIPAGHRLCVTILLWHKGFSWWN